MRDFERRLAKLEEQASATGHTIYVWANCGETPQEAIVRQFPAGLAESAVVVVFRWDDRP
jgi:hypothetical protein